MERGLIVRLPNLPDVNDAAAIFEFAMTFNGYEYFGSFDASATAAGSGDRSSLELLRNELFFAARASRHGDDDRFVDVYRQLLPVYREWLSTRNSADQKFLGLNELAALTPKRNNGRLI